MVQLHPCTTPNIAPENDFLIEFSQKNNIIGFFIPGTHWGKLYILDALGHIMPHLEEKFTKHSHSVAVSQISVDHPGEHIASCSTDGRVIITGKEHFFLCFRHLIFKTALA